MVCLANEVPCFLLDRSQGQYIEESRKVIASAFHLTGAEMCSYLLQLTSLAHIFCLKVMFI